MNKNQIEKGKKNFRILVQTLKIWRDWTDADLAREIGCTPQTIINARRNPIGNKATEPIRWLYEEEKERRSR